MPEPPTSEPRPPTTTDIATLCCESGFSCAAWPGNADIFLCSEASTYDPQSPCCQTDAYECEDWPGRAQAAICFGR